MYRSSLDAIILIGNLKVLFIATGWTSFIGGIILSIIRLAMIDEVDLLSIQKRVCSISIILCLLIGVASISLYSLPSFKENFVIAKVVATQLDSYMEKNPESIYNPDIIFESLDSTIKGITESVIELPKYIQKLASGQISIEKKIEDMSREELLRRIQELENSQ